MTEVQLAEKKGFQEGLERAWRIVEDEHQACVSSGCAQGYRVTGTIKLGIEHEITQVQSAVEGTGAPDGSANRTVPPRIIRSHYSPRQLRHPSIRSRG